MDARAAFALANAKPPPNFGRYYGDVGQAGIGAGMIVSGVEYPTFLFEHDRFGVVEGTALILTHECDLDVGNERTFNESAVICPILPLEQVVDALSDILTDEEAAVWIGNVTARYVNRVMYIPIVPEVLPFGGYLYLNLLTSTHRSRLLAAQKICMLSVDGLRDVDLALERHFRRPKADRLPFQTELVMGRG